MSPFFELLQVALGTRDSLSRVPNALQWEEILDESDRQAITGIMLDGIERLPQEQRPPIEMLLEWIGVVLIIEEQSKLLERNTEEVVKQLEDDGKNCVVLKGCGIAQLYPNPYRRQSGDIDVWILPVKSDSLRKRRNRVVKYLRNRGVNGMVVYHNMPMEHNDGMEVEVHFTPSWMNCWFTNRRLQRFFDNNALSSDHRLYELNNNRYKTPSLAFNRVFVLQHIYRHLFGSGIGLRQIVDYFYVLRQGFSEKERTETVKVLKRLHMMKFTGAVMWVLKEVMAIPENLMLCKPNVTEGRFLLSEILRAGNFGYFDDRIKIPENESKLHSFFRITKQNMRLLSHYPEETIWNPAYRAWHYVWRRCKGYPLQ